MSDEHLFAVSATFNPESKEGSLTNGGRTFSMTYTGAESLGGKGGAINPEELLLGGVAACFTQTWVIFLAKLQVPVAAPAVDASCAVDKDPAGGFRVTRIELFPNVPAALWESRRADVTKTLSLAERYCIVSKAVRQGQELRITPKVV